MKFEKINTENKEIWEINANRWNEFMGASGNDWYRELIAPKTIELLKLEPNSRLLDIGCGNGLFARRMSQNGLRVTAFDFSELNIRNAKQYDTHNIEYHVLDATKKEELISLGYRIYDGAVANMVLMDMPQIEIVFESLKELLINKGVFVFTILHPCFQSAYTREDNGDSLIITDYINPITSKGTAIPDQPKKQYYFHRPINYYMKLGFKNDFVVEGFEEPVFPKDKGDLLSKIPPVLIIKMRKV